MLLVPWFETQSELTSSLCVSCGCKPSVFCRSEIPRRNLLPHSAENQARDSYLSDVAGAGGKASQKPFVLLERTSTLMCGLLFSDFGDRQETGLVQATEARSH